MRWTWELRSVNGKSLDLRIRIPAGLETLEPKIRERCSKVLRRGNVSIGLAMQRDQSAQQLQVNEAALDAVLSTIDLLKQRVPDLAPPSLDGILSQKGVFDLKEPEDDEAVQAALHKALPDVAGRRPDRSCRHASHRGPGDQHRCARSGRPDRGTDPGR